MSYQIRTFGDPVLATQAGEVTDINGKVVRIVDEMFETLYSSDSGIGLAAPQVGIQRQIFVWDMEDDPRVIINPKIVEADGEWVYDEGCLSIPGLYVEMTRPKKVLMTGVDLDGNEISIEADELEARLFQHELDHLNGVLMFDRMQPDQRKRALEEYKRLAAQGTSLGEPLRLSAE
ncbi:MAG: peptide deformylase [Actinomycetota bacterium]|jgi:peptide deformylase